MVEGRTTPVLHVSQIAEALGLPVPPGGSPGREGADAAAVLEAWIDGIGGADWPALLEPTPARGRSLRNLTVNVFHPFELLPAAWQTGEFPWHPEHDGAREELLETRGELLRFAEAALAGWRTFLAETQLVDAHRPVATPRGEVGFSALVSFQRWHAAYHHRQLAQVLGSEPLLPDGLVLPREVF